VPRKAPDPSQSEGQWVSTAAGRLRTLDLSRPADSFSKGILKLLKEDDPGQTLDSIERMTQDLELIVKVLQDIYENGRLAERARAEAEPLGDAWMADLRRRLDVHRKNDASNDWFSLWMNAWTDAMAGMRWSRCDEIAALADPRIAGAGLRDDLVAVAAFLRDDEARDALAPLERILATKTMPVAAATCLRIVRTRILLRFEDDLQGAQRSAEDAIRTGADAPHPLRTLATISQAEVFQKLGRLEEAHRLLDPAMKNADATLDLLLAAGALALEEHDFELANELYDAAAVRFGGEIIEPRLLRSVPGNLLWRWSRRLAVTDKAAASRIVEDAIAAGIEGKGRFPAKKARLESAVLLEELGKAADAARAYYRAGEEYESSESPRALSLFRKACELAPEVAAYNWSYGEALRSKAIADPSGRVDLEMMSHAKQALDVGFSLADPAEDYVWVMATAALVAEALDYGEDPATFMERALLLDIDYAGGFYWLAFVLRKRGFVQEALAAAREAYARDPNDASVQLLTNLLCDQGEDASALETMDGYLRARLASPHSLVLKSSLQVRVNDAAGALDTLAQVSEDFPDAILTRGTAHAALGSHAESRACFETLWNQRNAVEDPSMTAWSAFRIGRLDDAVERYADLADQAPKVPYGLDLGQVRLVRGDVGNDDVAVGKRILCETIDRTNVVEDLRRLTTIEFPLVRHDVSGRPHEAAVLAMLDEVERRANDRCDLLLRQLHGPQTLAARLARARNALSAGEFVGALEIYVDLVRRGTPSEARNGLVAAAQGLLAVGDQLHRAGDLPAARAKWQAIEPAARILGTDDPLLQAILARQGLAALEIEGPLSEHAVTLLGACNEESIIATLPQFARDVPTLWAHYDGLNAIASATPDVTEQAKLRSVAAALPLSSVFALDRARAVESAAFLAINPIEIAISAAHAQLVDQVSDGISAVRNRLTDETGVKIPGVKIRLSQDGSPAECDFLVYEQVVARVQIPARTHNAQDSADAVLAHFEQVVRDNLFRLISVDDVDLWRQGWDALKTSDWESPWRPPDSFSRLRLSRLLRMLLREGLPVNDRKSILEAFAEAETDCADPLRTLRIARHKLYPAILGPDSDTQVHGMPEQLEARVAAGLSADTSTTWEMDRSSCISLLSDLRNWRAERLPAGPVVVRVADWRIRQFVWHLLSSARPRIYVVAAEEMP
jgi:tetratricopeptide (TPR) repeat protein